MRTIYKEIITSKTGLKIPLLSNGKTIESRYNPEIDVSRKIENIKKDDAFYLVIGLGSGLLVSELIEKNKNATFIIIENSNDDIDFLKDIPEAKKIIEIADRLTDGKSSEKINRIKICTKEELEKVLTSSYIPALHGNLNIIEQTNYLSADLETEAFIKEKINSALKNIMADFSVQAHFGKIWQQNIMQNLMQYKNCGKFIFPTEKIAIILAAGPTLDTYLEKLKNERDEYYVIATDTAFSTAKKHGIFSDAVVSIDGQYVSENHFLNKIQNNTLFVFDLCANTSAVKKVMKHSDKIIFANTGHPLSNYVSAKNPNSFVKLFAGTGTVTITAVDFAIKAGFSKIEIAGADFSYTNGKPYARGTYLDSLYNKNSTRILTSETSFSKLMYRTELIKKDSNSYTTEVLNSYKISLENYLKSLDIEFTNANNVYYISIKQPQNYIKENFLCAGKQDFSYHDFYKSIMDKYKSIDLSKINYNTPAGVSPLIISVLPYIASLRLSNPNVKMQEMVKLALTNMIGYNYIYEKK